MIIENIGGAYFPKGWFPKRHAKAYLFSDTASFYSDYCIKLFTF